MGIAEHQADYKPEIWRQYSICELGNWVHNFNKRATHRVNEEKTRKDLYDAKNYLWMIEENLRSTARDLDIDFDKL